jgi:hypothetical protein
MKLVYKSDDGQEFGTELKCLQYENELLIKKKDNEVKGRIKDLVDDLCDCEDYEGYTSRDVANFIFRYFDKISVVINK